MGSCTCVSHVQNMFYLLFVSSDGQGIQSTRQMHGIGEGKSSKSRMSKGSSLHHFSLKFSVLLPIFLGDFVCQ